MRKNLLLLFHHFEEEHFGKDVFLVPYYLAKRLQVHATIAYPRTKKNKLLPHEYRGVSLKEYIKFYGFGIRYLYTLFGIFYLLSNYKKIDYLICFHFTVRTALYVTIYKFINPQGKAYVKLDIPDFIVHRLNTQKNPLKRKLFHVFINNTNCFSCETSNTYTSLLSGKYGMLFNGKLVYMPNGFDEELIHTFDEPSWQLSNKKENLFMTVGRIGSVQKNSEMLLRAIEKVDCKTWKFFFIGNIEKEFQSKIDSFFEKYPQQRESVFFTGAILNREKLWGYYRRAKVFILTSEWESYGLVLNEAYWFENYILTTKVGAAVDLVNRSNGMFIPNKDSRKLSIILQDIIDNKINIEVSNFSQIDISWSNLLKRINIE